MAAKGEKEKDGVITAVYKTNLHCQQCAREIERPLLRTQGVQNVEIDMEKGEIKVKGSFDPIVIQKRIEKFSKKKIELISPKIQIKETIEKDKKVIKEIKQPIPKTTSVKVHMHCDQCERDLKKMLLRHKGIHSVKTDMKAQILTVDGTIEPDKLVSFLKRKGHKQAEIIVAKKEEKIKKEEVKSSSKAGEETTKVVEIKQDIKRVEAKPKDSKAGEETTKVVEIKQDIKVVEAKTKEPNAPYFDHYVYAPQLFSDENPNACSIM
ncbi:hypothetical protein UlMin_036878 [Ulmus minor]